MSNSATAERPEDMLSVMERPLEEASVVFYDAPWTKVLRAFLRLPGQVVPARDRGGNLLPRKWHFTVRLQHMPAAMGSVVVIRTHDYDSAAEAKEQMRHFVQHAEFRGT